jgi:hypothetical protein
VAFPQKTIELIFGNLPKGKNALLDSPSKKMETLPKPHPNPGKQEGFPGGRGVIIKTTPQETEPKSE